MSKQTLKQRKALRSAAAKKAASQSSARKPAASMAQLLFDGERVKSALEDVLGDADIPIDRLGWDEYDCSLEIHDVPADFRLTADAQRVIHGLGFAKVYVNHVDKWETHYNFPAAEFVAHEGWRVSYPHKRGGEGAGILVEAKVPSWPQKWFDTGYAVVIGAPKPEGAGQADPPRDPNPPRKSLWQNFKSYFT